MKTRRQLNNEIRLLNRIIGTLEVYAKLAHGLDVDDHITLYREWLQDATTELAECK